MSADGSLCPSCAKDIGVWSIMRAPLPNVGIRCPHCKVALKYLPVQWGFIGVLILLFSPVMVVLAAATWYFLGVTIPAAVVYVAVITTLWVPFELLMARRLRARSQLYLK